MCQKHKRIQHNARRNKIHEGVFIVVCACTKDSLDVSKLPRSALLDTQKTHTRQNHQEMERRAAEITIDTEAGMLSGISRKRNIRSNPYWFTEFCNSQCLSHFAAPFIVVRAETSIAESCKRICNTVLQIRRRMH